MEELKDAPANMMSTTSIRCISTPTNCQQQKYIIADFQPPYRDAQAVPSGVGMWLAVSFGAS